MKSLIRHTNWKRLQSIYRVNGQSIICCSNRNSPVVPQFDVVQICVSSTHLENNASFKHMPPMCMNKDESKGYSHGLSRCALSPPSFSVANSYWYKDISIGLNGKHVRCMSNTSVSLKVDNDVIRFSVDKSPTTKPGAQTRGKQKPKKFKKSKKAKVNELKLFRLLAKKKMKSPNPEVRIRYKLEKAKRKEAWLIEKLRKFEVPKLPAETHDPEILTEEEKFYLKRTGEKKKNYVPVGRRGVFGGVVLNMHLHWKKHETVKVICKPCKPGQVEEYAEELTRLSRGIVIDIKSNNTIIFYRGKNYVQPKVMSPTDTLSKSKALEKYTYEQSLEHTSQFIEKLENELEEYHKHVELYKKNKEAVPKRSVYNV